MQGLIGVIASVGAVGIFAYMIIFIGLSTVLSGLIMQKIGEKLSLEKHWRAFVPVGADLYALEIAELPKWNVFFIGNTAVLCMLIVSSILLAIGWWILVVIVAIIYGIAVIVFTVKFYNNFYRRFDISTRATVFSFVPGSPVALVFKFLIAFTDLFIEQAGTRAMPSQGQAYSRPASILGTSGMYRTASFEVNRGAEVVFGRDASSCNVIFDERSENEHISRIHCSIKYDANADRYYVVDKSSTGTYKSDNSKLPSNTTVMLPRGTEIYLGSKENSFLLV